jgi:hypothetical protein
MTPEGKIKLAVKKRLKELGAYQFWPVQTGYGSATLDCLICHQGKFYSIETKRPGKKPTPRQLLTIEEMQAAGAIVFVIDNLETARAFNFGSDLET